MPQARSCCLVGRRTEARITLLTEKLADGNRAVLVFGEPEAAEAFRIVEGLGAEWEVIEQTPDEAAELLGLRAAPGARYVSLDPSTALTRGEEEPQLVPIMAFIDHLLDGREIS
jgi:hypothetical protein